HAAYVHRVAQRYHPCTLERLALHCTRHVRRGAVLVLGAVGDYGCNAVLGKALVDRDRGVRMLAEPSIRSVWCHDGSWSQQQQLTRVIALNAAGKHEAARMAATRLLEENARFAEAWNQRAIANFGIARYFEAIADCRNALRLNVFHFGAAA